MIDEEVSGLLIRDFYDALQLRCAATLAVLAAIAAYFFARHQDACILLWAAACAGIALACHRAARSAQRPAASPRDRRRQARAIALATGLSHAAGPWFVLRHGDGAQDALQACLLAGLLSCTGATLAPLKSALLIYALVLTSGTAAALHAAGCTGELLAGFVLAALVATAIGLHLHALRRQGLEAAVASRRQGDQLRQQLVELSHTEREKSRFIAAAAHDLRQPLQAANLFVEALKRRLAGSPFEPDASRLQESIGDLNAAVDAILDLSRIDQGQVAPRLQPVEIASLFATIKQRFQAAAFAKGLDLRFRAGGLWVHADRPLLERLLANLVDNAIKYTDSGGILVAARLRPRSAPDMVRIEVRDSGRGIPGEHHDDVFQEFFQLDTDRGPDTGPGLGLGLSIVRRLAQLMEAPLSLSSSPGRGTTMGLLLPRLLEPGTAVQPAPAEPPADALASIEEAGILVVDDEEAILSGTEDLLSYMGCNVAASTSLAGALQAARKLPRVDLVILDNRAARRGSALEAMAFLRAALGQRLRFIVVTGESDPREIARLKDARVPVLSKPASPDRLLAAVAHALGSTDG